MGAASRLISERSLATRENFGQGQMLKAGTWARPD